MWFSIECVETVMPMYSQTKAKAQKNEDYNGERNSLDLCAITAAVLVAIIISVQIIFTLYW